MTGLGWSKASLAQSVGSQELVTSPISERLSFPVSAFTSANPATAYDMVTRVPGFRLEDGEDTRGLVGAAGNVLINGTRPTSKGQSVQALLSRIPAAQVERIDLLRGGGGGVDTQGRSAIVDVILVKTPLARSAIQGELAGYEGGPIQTALQYERAGGDRERQWSVQFSRGLFPNDSSGWGILTREDPLGNVTLQEDADNAFEAVTHGGRLDWSSPLAQGRLETSASVLLTNYEDRIRYLSTSSLRRFAFKMELQDGEFAATWRRTLRNGSRLEARLLQGLGYDELVSTAVINGANQIFATERTTGETVARVSLTLPMGKSGSVEMGLEGVYNLLDATQSFSNDGLVVSLPQASTRVDERRAEGFVLATWRPAAMLRAEAGVRIEVSRITQGGEKDLSRDFTYIKPRVALTFTPNDQHQLQLRLSRDVGQINFLDFAASTALVNDQVLGGNVDLRPDKRWSAELSYERRFPKDGVIIVSVRHQVLEDVVDFLPLPGGLSARGNIGDGISDRISLEGRAPLGDFGLSRGRLSLTAAYERAQVSDPTTGTTRGISFQSPSSAQIRFDNEVPRHRLSWGFSYEPYSQSPTYDPDQTRFYEVRDRWSVYAEVAPSQGWSARLEAKLWDDLRIERTVFAARNRARPIAFREIQTFDPRDLLSVRIRRAL